MRVLVLVAFAASGVVIGPAAGADPGDGQANNAASAAMGSDDGTPNIRLMSNSPGRGFTNSDLAFEGNLAYVGDFGGFRIVDISSPARPRVLSEFDCEGAQGDVSVYGGLLFRSVDGPRSAPACDSEPVDGTTPGAWNGIQVFDVSDPRNPEEVEFIFTDCGSHTHTLLPDGDRLFIYVSSYPLSPGSIGEEAGCFDLETDPVDGGHGYVSVIEIFDVNNPTDYEVHRAFLDEENTELVSYDLDDALGLPPGTAGTHTFRACHDISVFVELELAAAACFRDAQLWDISDPVNPELLWTFRNDAIDPEQVDLWHSATFSWDGSVVVFGEEAGGGLPPATEDTVGGDRCVDPTNDDGRLWFLDAESDEIVREDFLANYKIPRSEEGRCTAHLFNFIPQGKGRMTLVSSFYTGGTSVIDVNALIDGATEEEAEVAFLKPEGADTWASYWYNGFIYTNDTVRGMDVMMLADQARAGAKKLPMFNPQTQESVIR
jgi:hypothetical protein